MAKKAVLTFKYRIKDAAVKTRLKRYAWACNQVWNYCCQIQRQAEDKRKAGLPVLWPSAFDLINLCAGTSNDLGIMADTVCEVCRQFAASRNRVRRCPRFRSSHGSRRALGWVPFKNNSVRLQGDKVVYRGEAIRFWRSREIEGNLKTGTFVQDARGRWYVCFQCEVESKLATGKGQVGIDLGLKAIATLSDGTTLPALRHYKKYETALGIAQRAGNKRRQRAMYAKISNARRHQFHEWSTKIARENELIVVGNVSAQRLVKTKMAKSIMDASWGILKSQLAYKASRHGARFIEVDERWTSQTCSACGTIPASSPKGMGALGIRSWECSNCGAVHDRDRNAAMNILRIGLERQAPGEDGALRAQTLTTRRSESALLTAPTEERGRG